jgi:hypothetical protein
MAPTSTIYNDPHVRTLSGAKYDMHGVGVFEYASVGDDLRSQVYICPIEHGPGKMKQDLSFIAAMAVKTQSHVVVVTGDRMSVDGETQPVWRHNQEQVLPGKPPSRFLQILAAIRGGGGGAAADEGVVVSVGEHDMQTDVATELENTYGLTMPKGGRGDVKAFTGEQRLRPIDILNPKACLPSDEDPGEGNAAPYFGNVTDAAPGLRDSWIWHYCSPSGWRISTPSLALKIGIVGPFESGFLKPVTKDRSFNVAATPHTSVDWKSVRGVINGDKNGLFQKLRAEDSVAPGLMAVSAPNVKPGDELFPPDLLRKFEAECGPAQGLALRARAAVSSRAKLSLSQQADAAQPLSDANLFGARFAQVSEREAALWPR